MRHDLHEFAVGHHETVDTRQLYTSMDTAPVVLGNVFTLVRHALDEQGMLDSQKIDTIMDYAGFYLSPNQLKEAASMADEKCEEILRLHAKRQSAARRIHTMMKKWMRRCLALVAKLDGSNTSQEDRMYTSPEMFHPWKTTATVLRAQKNYMELQGQNQPFQEAEDSLY